MLGGKVQTAAALRVHGPQPSLIQPRGKIELGNPVLMQMGPVRSERQSGEGPLIQAKLGDILELKWEIMAMDEELDFLVRDCFAEPGTSGNQGERLPLIENGCPTPAVAQKLIPNPIKAINSAVKLTYLQAFRFDSSPAIRITCHLELCKENCKSVNCKFNDGIKESWGRKRRFAIDNNINRKNEVKEFETRRFVVPRFAQATTSLVIVDPLQQQNSVIKTEQQQQPFISHSSISKQIFENNKNITKTAKKSSSLFEAFTEAAGGRKNNLELTTTNSEQQQQLCLHKWTLGGVFGTLLTLIVVQSGVVAKHLINRFIVEKRI
uniref:ZP domain-containing protein n=1 Tax=Meloidogyne enterolobii TaxID=390850 RepID=A0A6V7TR60_MELEN|nr:unnamed protein product [Meloidogyne enterolobii]